MAKDKKEKKVKKFKTVADVIEAISSSFEVAKEEVKSFEEKEVTAAGLRARKALKEIKDYAQAGRKLVTEIKKSRKESKGKRKAKDKKKKK